MKYLKPWDRVRIVKGNHAGKTGIVDRVFGRDNLVYFNEGKELDWFTEDYLEKVEENAQHA